MNDVTALLRRAVDEEPPLGFGPDDLVARGRRARRRARLVAGGAGVAAVALAAAAFAAVAPGERAGLTATGKPPVPDEVTADNLVQTMEEQLGIEFREVDVRTMPARDRGVMLYGAIEDPAGDSMLNLLSHGGLTIPRPLHASLPPSPMPTCESQKDGSGPYGYAYHECTEKTLENGAVLIVRSGTAPGGRMHVTAKVVRLNGSSLHAESTNQDTVDPDDCIEYEWSGRCMVGPVTRADTGVTAEALGELLEALEPAMR